MAGGAQLSVTDQRSVSRHPVEYRVISEHHRDGDMPLLITNISAHGFMVDRNPAVDRGDRVVVRLPELGRIEAYCIWRADSRAGFQFERIIRADIFTKMIREMQPNERFHRSR